MIHLHPILASELNRQILARHLFVDAFVSFVCAMGWAGRQIAPYPVLNGNMPKAAYNHRLLSHSPLHDTIVQRVTTKRKYWPTLMFRCDDEGTPLASMELTGRPILQCSVLVVAFTKSGKCRASQAMR
jgi:hypothetical protein